MKIFTNNFDELKEEREALVGSGNLLDLRTEEAQDTLYRDVQLADNRVLIVAGDKERYIVVENGNAEYGILDLTNFGPVYNFSDDLSEALFGHPKSGADDYTIILIEKGDKTDMHLLLYQLYLDLMPDLSIF